MTKIAFQGGKPIMRDGKVGIGQDCCCDQPGCSRCIRNGEWDCQYTTQESCEECISTYQCHEILTTDCEDGTCPEGTTQLGEPPTITLRPENPPCWDDSPNPATATTTVGCGVILTATLTAATSGYAKLGRVAPTITAAVESETGSGAELAVTLEQYQDSCGFDLWRIASLTITSAGSGYTDLDPITITTAPGDTTQPFQEAFAFILEVDEDGGIVAVELANQGSYYREDEAAPPYVSPVSVTISPGVLDAADIQANIDDDPSSPTFGQILSLTVVDGGSGYPPTCERTRDVADCSECPPLESPESATCIGTQSGPCGEWTPGFPCDEPPCCDSCLPECMPTLDAVEITTDYEKTSIISGPPSGALYGPTPWNAEWVSQHAGCNLVWVEDYVAQTNATGTYCADWSYQQIHPDLIGTYVPPAGCYLLGTNVWCPQYTRRFWFRMRLFLVDCRDRTMREVTDEALTAPVERTGCVVPSKYECSGGLCGNVPLCDTGTGNYCLGANPGFLDAQPTLECAE